MDLAMVKFECNGCGRCCVSFGEFIKVERKVAAHDYYCRYGITNELFHVHVLPEYGNEFAEKFEELEANGKNAPQQGCVFMHRKTGVRVFSVVFILTAPPSAKSFSVTGC